MRRSWAPLLAIAALAGAVPHPLPGEEPWHDPSPHRVLFIQTAPDVTLEVLDWGGRGPAVVLLAGLGTTAHVYDDFAPKLASEFHVWGITRRGFGASSQPTAGYDPTTLAADVLKVLDSLGLAQVNLVGHSLAGVELTEIAASHPERVSKLVYLDSAYDFSSFLQFMRENPWPHLDPPTAADQATPKARLDWEEKAFGYRRPEADLRATVVFGAKGFEKEVTPDSIAVAIFGGFRATPYERVTVPALAIYATPREPSDLFPHRYESMDAPNQAAARKMTEATIRRNQAARQRFEHVVRQGKVLELQGANHYVFLSSEKEVLEAVRAFLKPAAPVSQP
jgi:non-heme chloroperoxidase